MTQTQRRPGGQTGPVAEDDHQGAGSLASLPVRYLSPPLDTMSPRAQAIWLEAYQLGYEHGIAEGIRQADEAEAAAWRRICIPAGPDIAQVQERRGEHERADRTRRVWAERGIAC